MLHIVVSGTRGEGEGGEKKTEHKKKVKDWVGQRREVVKNFQSFLGAATSTTDHALSRYAYKT